MKEDTLKIFKSIRKDMPPPSKVFKDKKKYTRKSKHKRKDNGSGD
jgi:hypothetical protein